MTACWRDQRMKVALEEARSYTTLQPLAYMAEGSKESRIRS
jgi:hypothetical protein